MAQTFNLPLKTIGGAQLWTDHLWRDGWRLQQNALTAHWRLIDDGDFRRAWGSRGDCQSALAELVPPPQDASSANRSVDEPGAGSHVVVLLHGLLRTHHCMKPLEQEFREAGQEDVVRFSYASSRQSIGQHASALREVLEAFPQETEFSFVGHSMGGIVVRRLIGDLQSDEDSHRLLPRCRGLVMLGTPNRGAAVARRLAATGLFEVVTGPGGMELGPRWKQFEEKLATPPFPFAIIAGNKSETTVLKNPLVEGPSDLLVSVDEAKLEGAEWFEVVPVIHSLLMRDGEVMKKTVDFILTHSHKDE